MKFQKTLVINISKDLLDGSYWDRIKTVAGELVFLPKDSPEIMKELADADALLVNFGIEVTKEHIGAAPNLKYIGILATAFGKVDLKHAHSKGIIITNLAGYSTESVAEFTIAAILEHIRKLEEGKKRGKDGNYSEAGLKAWEIKDRNFGVVGLGHIGTRVGEIAKGFGAHVQYFSRNQKLETGFEYIDIQELISSSDFLSINLPQTPKTEGFFDSEKFNQLKPNVVVINTAPMELINIDALCDRLAKGDITFILDHSDEMKEEDLKKLSQYDNCIVYPPMAYITGEARVIKQEMFTTNIEAFLAGSPVNTV